MILMSFFLLQAQCITITNVLIIQGSQLNLINMQDVINNHYLSRQKQQASYNDDVLPPPQLCMIVYTHHQCLSTYALIICKRNNELMLAITHCAMCNKQSDVLCQNEVPNHTSPPKTFNHQRNNARNQVSYKKKNFLRLKLRWFGSKSLLLQRI